MFGMFDVFTDELYRSSTKMEQKHQTMQPDFRSDNENIQNKLLKYLNLEAFKQNNRL